MIPKWSGPYEIVELKNKKNARLCNLKTKKNLATIINTERLKLYKQPPLPPEKKKRANKPGNEKQESDFPLKEEKKKEIVEEDKVIQVRTIAIIIVEYKCTYYTVFLF